MAHFVSICLDDVAVLEGLRTPAGHPYQNPDQVPPPPQGIGLFLQNCPPAREPVSRLRGQEWGRLYMYAYLNKKIHICFLFTGEVMVRIGIQA